VSGANIDATLQKPPVPLVISIQRDGLLLLSRNVAVDRR